MCIYIYIDSFKHKYNNNNNCYIHGKKTFKPKYGVRKLPTSHAKADWLTTSAILRLVVYLYIHKF